MSAIGVFDSGVGGLTVLRALRARFPAEDFIYLADTARLPYGTKSIQTISHYVAQCVAKLSQYDLKALVVACNSASTALLEHPLPSKIPIFNVIEPGARKAVQTSRTKRIGVLGTRATVHGQAYVRAIKRLDANADVHQQACPLFVPLVEEGWFDDPLTNLVVYRYVNQLKPANVDTLILGCTHYPVLHAAIAKAAGTTVALVDSNEALIEDMTPLGLNATGVTGRLEILCTDFSPRLEETVALLLGGEVPSIQTVDL